MGTFGLVFYGPYQYFWYGGLERRWPGRGTKNFGVKLTLNQICLSPVVISAIFAWNLALQGRLRDWAAKARADLVPTMTNGEKSGKVKGHCS